MGHDPDVVSTSLSRTTVRVALNSELIHTDAGENTQWVDEELANSLLRSRFHRRASIDPWSSSRAVRHPASPMRGSGPWVAITLTPRRRHFLVMASAVRKVVHVECRDARTLRVTLR